MGSGSRCGRDRHSLTCPFSLAGFWCQSSGKGAVFPVPKQRHLPVYWPKVTVCPNNERQRVMGLGSGGSFLRNVLKHRTSLLYK